MPSRTSRRDPETPAAGRLADRPTGGQLPDVDNPRTRGAYMCVDIYMSGRTQFHALLLSIRLVRSIVRAICECGTRDAKRTRGKRPDCER